MVQWLRPGNIESDSWIPLPTLPLTLSLGNIFSLSNLQYLHLKNGHSHSHPDHYVTKINYEMLNTVFAIKYMFGK